MLKWNIANGKRTKVQAVIKEIPQAGVNYIYYTTLLENGSELAGECEGKFGCVRHNWS